MGIGWGADQDGVDVAGGDDRLRVAHFRAGRLGEFPCRALVHVGERDQGRVGRSGDIPAVNLADAPCAEKAEIEACYPPCEPDRWLVRSFPIMIDCRQQANNGSREEWLKATRMQFPLT